MTEEIKKEIAASFPAQHEMAELGLKISSDEFAIFENGIYSLDMDKKWNIFIVGDVLYLARSWTNFCIYKVPFLREGQNIILDSALINRNKEQYKSEDIEGDKITLLKIIQRTLNREDTYVDPGLQLPHIAQFIKEQDPGNEFSKRIRSTSVGKTIEIHEALTANSHNCYEIKGWDQLKANLIGMSPDLPLIRLLITKNLRIASATYFDGQASVVLGTIIILTNQEELNKLLH